jgi:hypothetical protein
MLTKYREAKAPMREEPEESEDKKVDLEVAGWDQVYLEWRI